MQRGRRRRSRGAIIAAVVVVLLLASTLTRFYTDVLWFDEVGFTSVLWKSLFTELGVGLSIGLIMGIVLWLNLVLAARIAPAHGIPRLEVIGRPDPMDQYRDTIAPYLKWIRLAIAVAVGLLTGLAASSGWQTFLLWANRVPWHATDPQFHKDIGFYVFELPFYGSVLSWMWAAIFVALIATVAAHYFHGSIRPEGGVRGVTSGALAHISVLLGLLALVKAGQYVLGTYQLNFSPRGTVTGASYTDVHAQLPALRLLAIISVVSAILFLVNIRFRRVSLPLAAVGIWVLFAFLAGGLWPWYVQRFLVAPQEQQRERPYIARNIAATRTAFGLSHVQSEDFSAANNLTAEQLSRDQPILQNVRLWDPSVLQQVYSQLQAIRLYYRFEDVDIDRYKVDNQLRQVLLSPRELSLQDLSENSRTWSNLHLQYTHGFGLVASLANETTTAGQPQFLVKDVPGTVAPGAGSLGVAEPARAALYYGEAFEPFEYSVVNSGQQEVDYPTANGVKRSRYAGVGGIPVGSFMRRVAFAIRERDPNLVLSSLINSNSRILIYRNVRERVRRVAPFLSLDHDPYLAVVDGRMKWILDAYTSTDGYPYSERVNASDIVANTDTGVLGGTVNYVRNSVKVVVDAYDGTMKLYVVDSSDPLIRAWRNAFPKLFTGDQPSPDLRAHFRYPEDLFNIQTEVYLTYHMTDPANFYAKEDQWAVPDALPLGGAVSTSTLSEQVPPTYLLVRLPGETKQEFVLTRPFTPGNRQNMIAFMAAKSDPSDYGKLLTLLFPRDKTVLGPTQINNLINQDVGISRTLSLLNQRGSQVEYGSLVTLPIEDSILYIQPLFITAEGAGIPELKRIVVVYGENVVVSDSFEQALSQLFGIKAQQPTQPQPQPSPGPGPGGAQGGGRLGALVQRAGRLYDQAQQALQNGDFATYGRLIDRIGKLLQQARALSGGAGTGG